MEGSLGHGALREEKDQRKINLSYAMEKHANTWCWLHKRGRGNAPSLP
jgi:hypothetical protein